MDCRPKCRIRKIPRFSISKTVFCTGLDYFGTFFFGGGTNGLPTKMQNKENTTF